MTEPGVPQASAEAQQALAQLGAVIADPRRRARFSDDPRSALKDAGVAVEHLPDRMIDRLGKLSEDELVIIAEHCEDLVANGFYVELPNGGRACLF